LLESEEAVVVPGNLPECNKRKGVPPDQSVIGSLGFMDVGEKLGAKQVCGWFRGFECS
jgi:hypothetical protein